MQFGHWVYIAVNVVSQTKLESSDWFFKQEGDWMIYLTCVERLRGQLDPVFSSKDEHKTEQDFKIKYNMYRYWNAFSVGYAQYYSIVMRTLTLHTLYIKCRCTRRSNKKSQYSQVVNRTLKGNRGHEKKKIEWNYYFW